MPLAYGIHKLQISCVVEDEKVSIDWLQETLQEIEDFVCYLINLTFSTQKNNYECCLILNYVTFKIMF